MVPLDHALCVIAVALVGFVILNAGALDVSNAGKVTLKKVHAWIGYVFVLNLLWRIAWAFLGNRYARWRAVLPGGKGYFHTVRSYVAPAAEYSPAVPFVAGFSPLAVGLLTPAVAQHLTVFLRTWGTSMGASSGENVARSIPLMNLRDTVLGHHRSSRLRQEVLRP